MIIPLKSIVSSEATSNDPKIYKSMFKRPLYDAMTEAVYVYSAFSGALAACFTHFIVVPLDVIKTTIQLSSETLSSQNARLELVKKHGTLRGLSFGLAATNYGYFVQGAFKYGLFEYNRDKLFTPITTPFLKNLASASLAELIADIFLTPFEAARIRQVSQRRATTTLSALSAIVEEKGLYGLYTGFFPLVFRQVPYTASKLAVFESLEPVLFRKINEHRNVLSEHFQDKTISMALASLCGGLVSAVVSHPSDTLLTYVNGKKCSIGQALVELGPIKIWSGLRPRLVMIGGLATLQLIIYNRMRDFFLNIS